MTMPLIHHLPFVVSSFLPSNFLGRYRYWNHYQNHHHWNWKKMMNLNCQNCPMPIRYFLEYLLEQQFQLIPVPSPREKSKIKCFSSSSHHPINHTFNTFNHFLDNFGRPRTVLCQTIGKLVLLEKFWVTAAVSSKLSTTCHHPPGTKTVSPGFCRISS